MREAFFNVYMDEFGTQFVGAAWHTRAAARRAATVSALKWHDKPVYLIRVRLKASA